MGFLGLLARPRPAGFDEGVPFARQEYRTVNLAATVAVFPIIFFGELSDKTMFASLLMASRGHPRSVWLGATERSSSRWSSP